MKKLLITTAVLVGCVLAYPMRTFAFDPPVLVKDINTAPTSPNVTASLLVGNTLYLAMDGAGVGNELHALDLTNGSLTLVKDIQPGSSGSQIGAMVAVGTTAYFFADDGAGSKGLWKSDGSAAGTQFVKGFDEALPLTRLYSTSTHVYFTAYTAAAGRELWSSDGTSAGTQVIDLNPGANGSSPQSLYASGDFLFFSGDNGSTGHEPYYIDGSNTLHLIANINPLGSSSPSDFHLVLTRVFFSADDGTNGSEPWVSDGTPGGTHMLKNIGTGIVPSTPHGFVYSGTNIFFIVYATNNQVWKSDGVPGGAGTVLVKDLGPGVAYVGGVPLPDFPGKYLFDFGPSSTGRELFVSDGTSVGTGILKDIAPGTPPGLHEFIGALAPGGTPKFYFSAATSASGEELWVTDGTTAGTQTLIEFAAGAASGSPQLLGKTDTYLYLLAFDGSAWKVYRTDGTAAGTVTVAALSTIGTEHSVESDWTVANGKLYDTVNDGVSGSEPWVSDGTESGTVRLADIASGSLGSGSGRFVALGDKVLFGADDVTHGYEPWVTDGAVSTSMLADVIAGTESSNLAPLGLLGSQLIFSGFTTPYGYELFKSDGTGAGTGLLIDLFPGASLGFYSNTTAVAGGYLYFAGQASAVAGVELYRTDGTAAGTTLVRDIRAGFSSSYPDHFAALGNKVLFSADDGTHGTELWVTDGTNAGTQMVMDINAGSSSSNPSYMVAGEDAVFFAADDGTHGIELWRTDGTAAGTALVADISIGSGAGYPYYLSAFRHGVLFFASTASTGSEPYYSDGTAAGTTMLIDAYPGATSSSLAIERFAVREGLAFFHAGTSPTVQQIFVTDGTPAGTTAATALTAGPHGYARVGNPVVLGPKLFFNGDFDTPGNELYAMTIDACEFDPSKLAPGSCGCGTPDVDANDNGAFDCLLTPDFKAQIGLLRATLGGLKLPKNKSQRAAAKLKAALIKKQLSELQKLFSKNKKSITFKKRAKPASALSALARYLKATAKLKRSNFASNKRSAGVALTSLRKLIK